MANIAIEVKNISKDYNIYKKNIQRVWGIIFGKEALEVKHALKNVSFKVEKGERVVVLGVADSGCTTLMRLISGIFFPTKGKIVSRGSMNCILHAKAGLDNEFTCRENIYIKANLVGLDKSLVKKHEEEIIEFAEIGSFADLAMKRAPKGTDTKIALAVHLLCDSDILVIDDRLSSGGAKTRRKCAERLRQYLSDKPEITCISTNLKPQLGKQICNRGIVLSHGELAFDGNVEEAYEVFVNKYCHTNKTTIYDADIDEFENTNELEEE